MAAISTKYLALYDTGKLPFRPDCGQIACQEKCKVLKSPLFVGQIYMQQSFPLICFFRVSLCRKGVQAVERAEVASRGTKSKTILSDCRFWSTKVTTFVHHSDNLRSKK